MALADDIKPIEIDNSTDDFYDFDSSSTTTSKVSDLVNEIASLEQHNSDLLTQHDAVESHLKTSEAEVAALRTEIDALKLNERTAVAVGTRARELENEVEKLREELAVAMNEGDEASAEVREVRKALEAKGLEVDRLVNEKESLRDSLANQIEIEYKTKAAVEARALELANEVKNAEEEARKTVNDKLVEMKGLERRIEELEGVKERNVVELDVIRAEKEELESTLRVLREAGEELEGKLVRLQKEAEEAERVIGGFKESARAINGISREAFNDEDSKSFGVTAVAVGAGVAIVVAGVLCYLHYRKRE